MKILPNLSLPSDLVIIFGLGGYLYDESKKLIRQ